MPRCIDIAVQALTAEGVSLAEARRAATVAFRLEAGFLQFFQPMKARLRLRLSFLPGGRSGGRWAATRGVIELHLLKTD